MAIDLSAESVADDLFAGCRTVADKSVGSPDTGYDIAGHRVRLRFSNSRLGPFVSREIAHLEAEPWPDPDLVIQCWETGNTGVRPRLPWVKEDFSRLADPGTLGPRLHYTDHRFRMASTARNDLVIYDRQKGCAVYWVERQSKDSDRSQAATLREVLNWHLAAHGISLVHTAAVGDERGMVLLTGASGSGKSTTSLACLGSSLRFCGDDNCFVSMNPEPMVHSFYGSAKVSPRSLRFIPEALAQAVENAPLVYDKGIVFVSEVMPEKMIRHGPIRAIVSCRVTGEQQTRLAPAPAADAFRALAPTSMVAFSGNGPHAMTQMLQMVRRCPTWSLDLGRDIHRVPDLVSGLLDMPRA